ncbi:MAG: DUF188 domain-containing protein [Firmicutes bacterium]|nr:DUF188 domain-containing protein [Bacillota bacterium]
MTIFIDGDGCPVVDITIRLAAEAKVDCVIICDTAHIFDKPGAKTITVSKGNDSVDFTLVNLVAKGDIAVTQDYGLAAMCLARGAVPINQNGMVFNDNNMDSLLMQRHIGKRIRIAGRRLKGPAKRTKAQNQAFEEKLRELLQ